MLFRPLETSLRYHPLLIGNIFWTATLLNELTLKLGLHAVKVQANLCDHRGIKQNSQNFFIDHWWKKEIVCTCSHRKSANYEEKKIDFHFSPKDKIGLVKKFNIPSTCRCKRRTRWLYGLRFVLYFFYKWIAEIDILW